MKKKLGIRKQAIFPQWSVYCFSPAVGADRLSAALRLLPLPPPQPGPGSVLHLQR